MALFQQDESVQADEIKDSFGLLPNGAYDATIYEVEVGEFKSEKNGGKPRLIVTVQIAEGPYKNRQLKDFAVPLFTEEGNDWANRQAKAFFITALGFESFADIPDDVNELLGEEIKILVKTEKDQSDEDRNRIGRYLPPTAETSNGEGGVVAKEPAKKAKRKPATGKL